MFRASLAHHQEFRNCVCSQVSYSIILDSAFCYVTKDRIKNNWIRHLAAKTVPELLMMSEWRSEHVEFYHQIKSIKSCISLVLIWSLYSKMHGPLNIKYQRCFCFILEIFSWLTTHLENRFVGNTSNRKLFSSSAHWLSKRLSIYDISSMSEYQSCSVYWHYSCFLGYEKTV